MKVILLCAGYATRLYPLTENQPKALLPIQGRPILEWILEAARPVKGIDEIIVISNDRFAANFDVWAKKLKMPWPVSVVNDRTTSNETRLGAMGDLKFALGEKGVGSEDLLVIAGDNLFSFDLVRFVQEGMAKRPYPLIAVYDVKDRELAKRYGLVKAEPGGRVLQFYEKPADPPTTFASCGIYWLPRETRPLLDKYLADGNNPDQPGHYMRWLAETTQLYQQNLGGLWFDIGDLESYHKANEVFREKKGA